MARSLLFQTIYGIEVYCLVQKSFVQKLRQKRLEDLPILGTAVQLPSVSFLILRFGKHVQRCALLRKKERYEAHDNDHFQESRFEEVVVDIQQCWDRSHVAQFFECFNKFLVVVVDKLLTVVVTCFPITNQIEKVV